MEAYDKGPECWLLKIKALFSEKIDFIINIQFILGTSDYANTNANTNLGKHFISFDLIKDG